MTFARRNRRFRASMLVPRTVLISETASAPASSAAFAIGRISVTFGESFAISGRCVAFRHAHELVGKAVAESVKTGVPLDRLDLAAIDPAYTPEASAVFDLRRALAARTNPGSPSTDNVRAESARWRNR